MSGGWPAFEALLAALGTVPFRTGSVISTIYGDAILPRGGSLALADLLTLMGRLGASEGVVRTAVSRLAKDGVLAGRRRGRTSAYALTEPSRLEFEQAVPLIYGPLDCAWDGVLRLGFPLGAEQRLALDALGFAMLVPGAMIGLSALPPDVTGLDANGDMAHQRKLADRAWPAEPLAGEYTAFVGRFEALGAAPTPLDAMAARTMLIHCYRRLALRTPRLPTALRYDSWPGTAARQLCIDCYVRWVGMAEHWLDDASDGSGPLPRGADPLLRLSGGDTRPWGTASSPGPAGSQRRGQPAPP